jgi:hypothetical protein
VRLDLVSWKARRRKSVEEHEVLRRFKEVAGKDGAHNTEEELRITKLFIGLLEGEGVAGREVATM